tara:strand:+ start:707 stop:832 length:126 start_codon:yes stop_codon:yes gene_type:complete
MDKLNTLAHVIKSFAIVDAVDGNACALVGVPEIIRSFATQA